MKSFNKMQQSGLFLRANSADKFFFPFSRLPKKRMLDRRLLPAKKDLKPLSTSSDGLERSMMFDWVQKSNAIEPSYKVFGSILYGCRTQLNPVVRLSSIEVDYRTVGMQNTRLSRLVCKTLANSSWLTFIGSSLVLKPVKLTSESREKPRT